jgi:hypothetical protein
VADDGVMCGRFAMDKETDDEITAYGEPKGFSF